MVRGRRAIQADVGRDSVTQPVKTPIVVNKITWTVVCRAKRVTGASTPLRADFDKMVLQIAQDEWNRTVKATLVLEAGGFSFAA